MKRAILNEFVLGAGVGAVVLILKRLLIFLCGMCTFRFTGLCVMMTGIEVCGTALGADGFTCQQVETVVCGSEAEICSVSGGVSRCAA